MAKNRTSRKNPIEYISPLNMDGLQGRMLRLPAPQHRNNREILLIYGHHASLERLFGLAEALNDYGAVTMPDLPGFGGMQSFYKIGQKPTLDNMADYLAAFVKMQYRRKRLTIVGFSFGFVVATRMLQRYPELVKKIDILISAVGFMHRDDFTFTGPRYLFYRYGASFFSNRLPAFLFRNMILQPVVLRTFYSRTHNAKVKFADLVKEEKRAATDFEVMLWRTNDLRTYMDTTVSFLTLDNCHKKINLPVWHVAVKADNYFDNRIIEQHMRVVFTDYHQADAELKNHSMTVIADKNEASVFIPKSIQKLLKHGPPKVKK